MGIDISYIMAPLLGGLLVTLPMILLYECCFVRIRQNMYLVFIFLLLQVLYQKKMDILLMLLVV